MVISPSLAPTRSLQPTERNTREKLPVLRTFVLKPVRLMISAELVLQWFVLFFQIGCSLILGHTRKGAPQRQLVFEVWSDHRRVRSGPRSYLRRTP